ncbi:MAG: serine/threonine protein phosphatase, partial [Paracoccaceae bacterium]
TDIKAHDEGLRRDLSWLHPRLGGVHTLASYGVANAGERPLAPVFAEAVAAVPKTHRDFLENLPTSYQRGQAIYVHAGIRPGLALGDQTETDLIWIRDVFLTDPRDHGALIVHGHTAIDAPTHYGNRLNIDSGAAYGGPLTAVVIEGRQVFHLTPAGRVPLIPQV